jgi:hypothetical protein
MSDESSDPITVEDINALINGLTIKYNVNNHPETTILEIAGPLLELNKADDPRQKVETNILLTHLFYCKVKKNPDVEKSKKTILLTKMFEYIKIWIDM